MTSVAPLVDGNTRNGLIYVDLPSSTPKNALQAGMFAQGQFILGQTTALSLPQSAILLRDGFAYVFVIDQNQKASQQKISLGQRVGDLVEVMVEGAEGSLRKHLARPGLLEAPPPEPPSRLRILSPFDPALRDRFAEMQASGGLIAPAECAMHLVDFLLDEDFGREPVLDLRELMQ
mgnify:CR=1 FL=1